MTRINCWFLWPFLCFSLNFVDIFWAFTKFCWPFLVFHYISLTFFELSLNFVDLFSAFDSSVLIRISSWLKQYLEDLSRFNSWLTRLSRNWLRINSWLKWIPQILIQIVSWLKKCVPIFRLKPTHGSSENYLILSRLMIRLWVIPISAMEDTTRLHRMQRDREKLRAAVFGGCRAHCRYHCPCVTAAGNVPVFPWLTWSPVWRAAGLSAHKYGAGPGRRRWLFTVFLFVRAGRGAICCELWFDGIWDHSKPISEMQNRDAYSDDTNCIVSR